MPAPLTLTAPSRSRPSRLASYEVVRRLGAGPASEVLLAIAHGPFGFERTVVLKRLPADAPPEARRRGHERLGREALACARLAHPAIVRLYDFVEEEGQLTLVLEHVDGLSLAEVLQGLAAVGDVLDDASVWYIGYRVFLALAAAHAARDPMTRELATVIHRDVCPHNVLVGWDGYVKLSGFGVARVAGVAIDTEPGVIHGTVGYLAPEQVGGEPASVRADVYGGCLVLRELLLRAPAFPRGDASDGLGQTASPWLAALASLRPGVPRILSEAIDRGLAPDPEQRGVTAEEMVGLLRAVIDIESGRESLATKIARLRRADDGATRTDAFATRPDIDTQQAVTSRPPPMPVTVRPPPPPERSPPRTSRVMPRAQSQPSSPVMRSYSPFPSAVLPVMARPLPPVAPPPPARRDVRASPPMIFETPNVMTTQLAPPRRRSSSRSRAPWVVLAAALAIGSGVAIGGILGWQQKLAARDALSSSSPSSPKPPSSSGTPARTIPSARPAPPSALAPPPSPPLPSAAPASTTGRVLSAPSEAGHRLFVDGRFAGPAATPLTVRCGKHDVRVGSTGHLRRVTIPCGGDLLVER